MAKSLIAYDIIEVMNNCVFCTIPIDEPDRLIKQFQHWTLILQLPEKLKLARQAVGLLISNRHIECPSDATEEEFAEAATIIKESARLLCEKVGSTYTDQKVVGFNQGSEAGQTIFHAHIHILPIAEEDEPEMKVRAGIGGAFEALRRERMKQP